MQEVPGMVTRGRPLPDPLLVVTPSGCWEWQGSRLAGGYGVCDPKRFGVPELSTASGKRGDQRTALAHRVSYVQNVGPIPDGMVVRHRCDNPPCVNPDHLELGSQADNIRDMWVRERRSSASPVCIKCGADLTDAGNVYVSRNRKGWKNRGCRPCRRAYARNRYAAKKGRPSTT